MIFSIFIMRKIKNYYKIIKKLSLLNQKFMIVY